MASHKSTAEKLLEQADKKAASTTGWFSSYDNKWDKAADLYMDAANAFKIEKQFKEAGDAHAREAECRENIKEKFQAAHAWHNAAKAYRRISPELAIPALSHTVTLLTQCGHFRSAADRENDIAMIYVEDGKLLEGCKSYMRAGDWYAQEGSFATANRCFINGADLYADIGEYDEAIQHYENVAKSDVTKYKAPDYLFRACLCALAKGDLVAANNTINRHFPTTTGPTRRQSDFLKALREAINDNNEVDFTAAVVEYDQIRKLDDLDTRILLKIKRRFAEEPSIL